MNRNEFTQLESADLEICTLENRLVFWRILTAGLGLTIVALLILWPK